MIRYRSLAGGVDPLLGQERMDDPPSLYDLCFEFPLYAELAVAEGQDDHFHKLMEGGMKLDGFCIHCHGDTIFIHPYKDCGFPNYGGSIRKYEVVLSCGRNTDHQYRFIFECSEERNFRKIGQFPSLADLATATNKRFEKVLDPAHLREFNKAIGLASHGVGIGSFVYLRRIFEKIVEETADAAEEIDKDKDFVGRRMDQKITLLKDHLPSFLVENAGIYGILSKGIHELEEGECLEHFPSIRAGIQLILEDRILIKKRDEERAKAAKEIQRIVSKSKTA